MFLLVLALAGAATSAPGDRRLVHFKATAAFDPVQAVPQLADNVPEGPSLKAVAESAQVVVVQLSETPTYARQLELASIGVKVLDYVPDNALLVRPAPGVSLDRIRLVSGVRAVFELAPGLKLSPELAGLVGKAGPEASSLPAESWVEAALFTGADPDALGKSALEALPGVKIAWTKRTDPGRVRFVVPGESLRRAVGALAAHPDVAFIELAHEPELVNDNSVWIGQSYDRTNGIPEAQAPDPKPYGFSGTIWKRGLLGQGQIVGVLDLQINYEMGQFLDPTQSVVPQTVPMPDPLTVSTHRKIVAYNTPAGENQTSPPHDCIRHGTHVTGSILGDCITNQASSPANPGHDLGDGMAPLARVVFENAGPGEGGPVSDLLLQQYGAGARVSTFSWNMTGYDVDEAVWHHPDHAVFASAGNTGVSGGQPVPGLLGSDNKNAIVVGASENYTGTLDPENMAAFSSEGPASDGRIKPDLSIPGFLVRSAKYPSTIYPDPNDPHCNPNDPNYCFARTAGGCVALDTTPFCGTDLLLGTSMSSPTAAGLGALARQYFTDGLYPTGVATPANALTPSAALIKAVMINGARNMTGRNREMRGTPADFGPLADAPGFKQGWGRIALDDALYFPGDGRRLWLADVPNAQGLFTADSALYTMQVTGASPSEPLKVTLAWTDAPAFSGAGPQLRDNLDLVVTAPDGTVYRGNQWIDNPSVQGDKRSQPNAAGSDTLNNVEGILIPAPASGQYKVEIRGTNVPGYVPDNAYRQGFALVVTAAASALQAQPCTTAAPPQNPSATVLHWDDVLVSWNAVPGALGYKIRRSTGGCGVPPPLIIDVPAGQTSYHDTTTQPGTTYAYTVRAVMSADGCQTADSECKPAIIPAAPTVSSVSPNFGINNDPITITINGTNFANAPAVPRVYLGTAAQPQKYQLSQVTYLSATQIQATVPVNLQSATYSVTVINASDLSGTRASVYSAYGPVQSNLALTAEFGNNQDRSGTISALNADTMTLIETKNLGPNSNGQDVAARKDGTLALAACWGGTVRAFLPTTRTIVRTVSVPPNATAVVIHPSGNPAYVLSTGSPSAIRRLDLTSFTITGTATIGSGQFYLPVDDLEISPDGSQLFATNSENDSVSIVRTSDMVEVARIPVGDYPLRLAVSTDGSRLYVSNHESDTISVIDAVNRVFLRTINVANHPPNMTNRPHALALSSNNTVLHVGNEGCCTGLTNRANVNLSNDQMTVQIMTAQHQWDRFQFWPSNGKLYAVAHGLPSTFIRLNKDTLAIEASAAAGDISGGLAMVEPPALTITSVSPVRSCPLGGQVVTIRGSGFQGEVRDDANTIVQARTRVFFGGTESTNVTLVNSTTLTAVAPPHTASLNPVPVLVINPSGRQATLNGVFRYNGICLEENPGGGVDPE